MPIANTSAGRLHTILVKLLDADINSPISVAWANALEVNAKDLPRLTGQVGLVYALPQQVEDELKRLKHYHPYLVAWRPSLANLFAGSNFGAAWSSVSKNLTVAVMSGVEACALQLAELPPEPQLEDDALAEFSAEARQLYDDARQADIDPDLRHFILGHLSAIIDAVNNARIQGVGPIEREMKAAVAEVVLNVDLKERTTGNELGRRFWDLLEKYAVIFTFVTSPFQLGQIVNTQRPALPPPPPEVVASVLAPQLEDGSGTPAPDDSREALE